MSESHLDKVDFDFIRYANCWEDADILLKALKPDSNSKIMSIASGGDNCFSLASLEPKEVIAVDISTVQLYLVELKMAAIKTFDRETYMQFAGFIDCEKRESFYQELNLSPSAKKYWDAQLVDIKRGIIHIGKFENYFQYFKSHFLRSFHAQDVVDGLFAEKSAEEQLAYYNEHWFKEGWADKHAQFFSSEMLGEKGRDPEFFKHFEGSVSDNILRREVAHLKTKSCQSNYLLFYILNNRFDENHLPHYVRKENYQKVKENLNRITLHQGFLEKAVEKFPDCTHFNLSNIFEYMDEDLFKSISLELLKYATSDAKFAYWNFLIHRNMADLFSTQLIFDEEICSQYSKEDKGYFYKAFILNSKK